MATTQGIKLDDQTQSRLKALGAKRKRSPHWLMRTAVEDYLEREERYEQEKSEDLERWEHYVLTGNAIDGDKVERWLEGLASGKASNRAPH
ncbi:MAG: ribbon-helix-helix protein, CopG family [Patescibacteria group bacterium]